MENRLAIAVEAPGVEAESGDVGVGSDGQPWIDLPAYGRTGAPARTTVPLGASLIGREVVVSFLDGSCDQPVVTGVVQRAGEVATAAGSLDATVDGERVLLTALNRPSRGGPALWQGEHRPGGGRSGRHQGRQSSSDLKRPAPNSRRRRADQLTIIGERSQWSS